MKAQCSTNFKETVAAKLCPHARVWSEFGYQQHK